MDRLNDNRMRTPSDHLLVSAYLFLNYHDYKIDKEKQLKKSGKM